MNGNLKVNFEKTNILETKPILAQRLFLEMWFINSHLNSINFQRDTEIPSDIYAL